MISNNIFISLCVRYYLYRFAFAICCCSCYINIQYSISKILYYLQHIPIGKLSQSDKHHCKSLTQDHEMSTNPGPQNMFKWLFPNFMYDIHVLHMRLNIFVITIPIQLNHKTGLQNLSSKWQPKFDCCWQPNCLFGVWFSLFRIRFDKTSEFTVFSVKISGYILYLDWTWSHSI